MRNSIFASIVALLWPLASAWGQVQSPNAMGVSFGHWHTLVRDTEATKKFWIELGGTPIKIDGTDVIKFHGGLVFLSPGAPTGPSKGTTVNHVGLGVPNVQQLFAKLQADGIKFDPTRLRKSAMNGQYLGDVYTPDDVRVEITEEAGVAPYPKLPPGISVEINHMELFVADSARKDMQAWYVKTFGGEPSESRGQLSVSFPGVQFLRVQPCGPADSGCPETGGVPTKGRALDHIGFEVRNLGAFCKRLEASGVQLDAPYSKSRHKSFASAEITDPWGVSIELTEGLNRF